MSAAIPANHILLKFDYSVDYCSTEITKISQDHYRTFFQQCCSAKTFSSIKQQADLAKYIHYGVLALKRTDKCLLDNSLRCILRLARKEDVDLCNKIEEICSKNGIIQTTIDLEDYRTRNLIPIKKEKGKYGGSLITVKVDVEFRFATASSDRLRSEQLMNEYNRQLEEAKTYSGKDKPSLPIEPFIPQVDVFLNDGSDIYKSFPTWSANPESGSDPQGDIGWMLFLPQEIQALFGFSKQGNCYTFPDIDETNGGIEEFNDRAKQKGFGDNYIPYRLGVVGPGLVDTKDYLLLRGLNKIPVAAPKRGKSWFYHDYLYHVIGMLLTPREALTVATDFVCFYKENYHDFDKDRYSTYRIDKNLTKALDHSTTWALRIASILYLEKNQGEHDFYCFDTEKNLSYCGFEMKIKDFSYFARFNVQKFPNRTDIQTRLSDMGSSNYSYEDTPNVMPIPNDIEFFKTQVRNHLETLQEICKT